MNEYTISNAEWQLCLTRQHARTKKRPVSMNIGTGLFDKIVFTGLCGSISF